MINISTSSSSTDIELGTDEVNKTIGHTYSHHKWFCATHRLLSFKMALIQQNKSEILDNLQGELLKCTVCKDNKKNPLILPCHHSFCEACVEKLKNAEADNEEFSCPECRTSCPKAQVVGDFTSAKLRDTLQVQRNLIDKKHCYYCKNAVEDGAAAHVCMKCVTIVCPNCCGKHDHACGGGEARIDLSKTSDVLFCRDHQGEVSMFYCQQCSRCLCPKCTTTQEDNHPGHTISKLEEELCQYRHRVDNKSKVLISELAKGRQRLEEKNRKWAENKEKVKASINAHAEALIREVNGKKEKMLSDLDRYGHLKEDEDLVMEISSRADMCDEALGSRHQLLLTLVDKRQAIFEELNMDDVHKSLEFRPNSDINLGELAQLREVKMQITQSLNQLSFLNSDK